MTTDPTSPPKQRCLALTRRGDPCRNWAMRGSRQRHGRPLCRAHIPDTGPDLGPDPGPGSGPAPDEIVPWHLYAPYFSPAEHAALEQLLDTLAGENSLTGEISTARIMLRRLLAHMATLGPLTTDQITHLIPLVLTSTGTIARLLQVKEALGTGQPHPIEAVIQEVLLEMSEEWEVDL